MNRVLLIDDDPIITKAYTKLLRANGFVVATAHDGEMGLVQLERFKPDVVLLDLDMPKISGIEWLKRVREDDQGKKLPVIILTAGRYRKQVSQAVSSSVTFVLSKTASSTTVIEAIAAAAAPGGLRVYT